MRRLAPLLLLVTLGAAAWSAPVHAYHLVHEIHFPGQQGWDYLTADPGGHRLFVTHGDRVEVIDLQSLEPLGTIADTPGVHGVALAPDLGRGFVSAGGSDQIVVFDLKTLARLAEIKTTGANPDAILFDRATHRVFTFNGRGRNTTVMDASTQAVVGTIALDAKPEFAVSDEAGHVFVNLEDRNVIAEIDPRALRVTRTFPLPGCEEPSGLAIDRRHHRLFSVCGNNVMAIVDASSGKLLENARIGAGPDAASFDAATQLVYASAGDGTLTILKETNPNTFTLLQTLTTRPGARTMTLDEGSHRLFLSTAQREPTDPAAPRARPKVIPDTFVVLVFEP
jgi:DNA-binding beta-propeller fold protein YncE